MVKTLFPQFSLFELYKLFFIQHTAFSRSPSWAQNTLLFGPSLDPGVGAPSLVMLAALVAGVAGAKAPPPARTP